MRYGTERNTIMEKKESREERKSISIESCINFISWKKLHVKNKEKKLIYKKIEMILRSYEEMKKRTEPKDIFDELENVIF